MSQGFAREARVGFNVHIGETLYFTANDTFEKADYDGLYGVRVRAVGGGGGGGGAEATSAGETAFGSGGSAGTYAESIILAADLGTSETITIGSGGAGGSGANDGVAGGETSFGSLVTAGGGGRGRNTLSTGNYTAVNSIASDAGTGDLVIVGQTGETASGAGSTSRFGSSVGAPSPLGGGGGVGASPKSVGQDGGDGAAAGAGGGGAGNRNNQGTDKDGGDGADGIVIVEVLYERKIAVDEDIHTQYLNDTRHNAAHGAIRVERATSDQTVTAGDVLIFNSIVDEDDPDGDFTMNTSTGELTINNAGWYQINVGTFWENPSANALINIQIKVDGSAIAAKRFNTTDGARVDTMSTLVKLTAAEVVTVTGNHNDSSGTLDLLDTPGTFLTVNKVRE